MRWRNTWLLCSRISRICKDHHLSSSNHRWCQYSKINFNNSIFRIHKWLCSLCNSSNKLQYIQGLKIWWLVDMGWGRRCSSKILVWWIVAWCLQACPQSHTNRTCTNNLPNPTSNSNNKHLPKLFNSSHRKFHCKTHWWAQVIHKAFYRQTNLCLHNTIEKTYVKSLITLL